MKMTKLTNNKPTDQWPEGSRSRDGILEVEVTYLETCLPLNKHAQTEFDGEVTILQAIKPSISFYRYLYEQVGRPWLWYERCAMNDKTLLAIITNPTVAIYVIYVDGVPAGYAELDYSGDPMVELSYFGLVEQFIGRGIGWRFLNWILDVAWRKQPNCIRVNTCTLDHPNALSCYQNAGFTIYNQEVIHIRDPRLEPYWPKS